MSRPDAPIRVVPAQGTPVPVVLSVPHSGVWIPDEELAHYAIDSRRLLRDGDLHVDRLYADASQFGIASVVTEVSRFVVDLNRFEDDLAATAAAGRVARRQAGYYGDRGLVWGLTTTGERIYRAPLARDHVERRVETYWRPYHDALRQLVDQTVARFGLCILLDAHSMPSRAARLHPDRGSKRADVVPGDLFGEACAPWLMQATVQFWSEAGYSVHPNSPYSGGAITRTYGRPQQGVHAIQLELNRALYMNERSLEPSPAFASVRRDCSAYLRVLAERAVTIASRR